MAEHRRSGKLAVILHADIAGSTALVRQDEQVAHERIQDAFRRFGDTITTYHGRVRELRGDALLAEFERVSDAASAAICFQATQSRHNDQLDGSIRPEVRVGIALGEVIVADDTVTGAGVVLAQRVERLAEPGGLCVTGAIHEALPERMPFDQEDLGEQQVKGFNEAIRVYRVGLTPGESIPPPQVSHLPETPPKRRKSIVAMTAIVVAVLVVVGGVAYWFVPSAPTEEPASVERMAFPLPDKPSIAVLPFTNMSDHSEQEYFADGITEDLITDLSKLSNMFVISRNSTFVYKGKSVKIEQVASELNVRYVLEGSVRRVGNQVRINAQLIDGENGGHLWAERYDGTIDDVFALQDDISKRIVQALSVTLTPQEIESIKRAGTTNTEAYDAYLLGLFHYYRDTPDDDLKATINLRNAIKLDVGFSTAYTALVKVYARVALRDDQGARALGFTWHGLMGEILKLIRHNAVEADVDFHVVQSWLTLKKRQHNRAIDEANRALSISPNNADALEALAEALIFSGKIDDGLAKAQMAMHQNPAQISRPLYLMGLAEYLKGNPQAAIDLIQKAIDRTPERIEYSGVLAAAYVEVGDLDQARTAFTRFGPSVSPRRPNLARLLAWFPAAGRDVQERYARNMVAAGANDIGFLPLYAENRLTGDEIRSLLFGKKITGTAFWMHDGWEQYRNSAGEVEHSGSAIINGVQFSAKQGFGRIVDDLLCERWPEFIEDGEICVSIFRILDKDSMTAHRGDYVMVTDIGPHPFRITE